MRGPSLTESAKALSHEARLGQHDEMTSEFGTYRVSDGSKVEFSVAIETWVPLAYEALVKTAGRYNGLTTYLELTELVQETSGVRTKMLIGNWSGKLLEQVARVAAESDDAPLTSLCVHQDGTIGDGYVRAPKSVSVDPLADVDELAAEHRLLCYRKYASDLPIGGGAPTLTPKVAERRARRRAAPPAVTKLCSKHHVQLSATGACLLCE